MSTSFAFPQAAILIFCKAPFPGQVKTRLLSVLTPAQAAALHAHLTHALIASLAAARLAPLFLYCYPNCKHRFFLSLQRRYGATLFPQRGADLGERMLAAFQATLTDRSAALAIGCDCPGLAPADCAAALQALAEGFDAVLGPAEDGGYVLLGLKRAYPELFRAMPWGSSKVLAETRRRINRLGLRLCELSPKWDLDQPEDLQRFKRTCQRSTTCRRRQSS